MTPIDTYLVSVKPSQKPELERIRQIIKQTAPNAEEVISYGIPTFKYKKQSLIHFAAFKNHMSLFPTAEPVEALEAKLTKYRTSKGTIQFTEDNPLPEALIEELVMHRMKTIDK